MHISREQNEAATAEAVAAAEAAWGALGVTASSVVHSSGHGYAFLRLAVPRPMWSRWPRASSTTWASTIVR